MAQYSKPFDHSLMALYLFPLRSETVIKALKCALDDILNSNASSDFATQKSYGRCNFLVELDTFQSKLDVSETKLNTCQTKKSASQIKD